MPNQVICRIQISLTSDGNTNLQCETSDPHAALHALGQAVCLLSAKMKEAQKPKIEIATAPLPLLPQ
jgi:hypothetical protein